eukprot:1177194-Prorocentrum_minimum.AAC.10
MVATVICVNSVSCGITCDANRHRSGNIQGTFKEQLASLTEHSRNKRLAGMADLWYAYVSELERVHHATFANTSLQVA